MPAYTTCYASKDACEASLSGGGGGSGGGSSGGGSGNSAGCDAECPANTLEAGLTRPTFVGPNCYDSQYGSGFGPDWKPSGKTRFEYFFPSPTEFQRFVWISSTDSPPVLGKSWGGASGCNGSAAVYENVVCAIEILQQGKKQFEGTKAAPGYYIDDFLNSGDETSDKLELATFFAHKYKETARLTLWEEAGGTYAVDDGSYPPVSGASYRGRGPVQISYNFNYGPFSEWLFGDKDVLLSNPDMVDPEGPMGFIAAFWFWMTPRDFTSGAPVSGSIRTRDAVVHWTDGKMNALYNDGVDYDSVAGLGLTTNVINGGIECPSGGDSAAWRVSYFLTAADKLGLEINHVDDPAACANDKLCNGLFSGCSGTKGMRCSATSGLCSGDTFYYSGWSKLCA